MKRGLDVYIGTHYWNVPLVEVSANVWCELNINRSAAHNGNRTDEQSEAEAALHDV